ncbi:MAG: YihY/virulence factor BrkB family protein [Spirochaetia bacterium]|nr:YihY/virulence factor BrkB family protein [Spirochaetia bacterium]
MNKDFKNNLPKEEKKNKIGIVFQIKKLTELLYAEEESAADKIKNSIKRIIVVIQKFIYDEALLRAASISYSLIISFIPALIVALMIGSNFIQKDMYFMYAKEFLRKENIPIDIEPYIEIINEMLQNAATIGGIGILVILFSATSVLRNIENAVNKIWRVQKERPFIHKISGFLVISLLGPAVIAAGISSAESFVSSYTSANLNVTRVVNSRPVILGEKSTYLEKTKFKFEETNIIDKIDFINQKNSVIFASDNSLVSGLGMNGHSSFKTKTSTKNSFKTSGLKDMAQIKNDIFLITDKGEILHSNDNGLHWKIQKYLKKDVFMLTPLFTKIKMFTDKTGIILGGGGLILKTIDGGNVWQPSYIEDLKVNLNDIKQINESSFIIAGDSFTILISKDKGETWQVLNELKLLNSKESLKSIFVNENKIFICGDFGTLLTSDDMGQSWHKEHLSQKHYNLNKIYFLDKKRGLIAGSEGMIWHTETGGKIWQALKLKENINLNDIEYITAEKKIYVLGAEENIFSADEKTFYNFSHIQKTPLIRYFISALSSIFIPFVSIWIIFFFVYKLIPFTEVKNKSSALGAAAGSVLWVLFLLFYKIYISYFSKVTYAVYGTMAAIPLGLLFVYVSIVIMLLGAEIAFFVQYPYLVRLSRKNINIENEKTGLWSVFSVLRKIYIDFESKEGKTKQSRLLKYCDNNFNQLSQILIVFTKLNIIQKIEDEYFIPVISPKNIKIKNIIDNLDYSDYIVPVNTEQDNFTKKVKQLFNKANKSKADIFKNITFDDLLK